MTHHGLTEFTDAPYTMFLSLAKHQGALSEAKQQCRSCRSSAGNMRDIRGLQLIGNESFGTMQYVYT
jgi:hypothetical protein